MPHTTHPLFLLPLRCVLFFAWFSSPNRCATTHNCPRYADSSDSTGCNSYFPPYLYCSRTYFLLQLFGSARTAPLRSSFWRIFRLIASNCAQTRSPINAMSTAHKTTPHYLKITPSQKTMCLLLKKSKPSCFCTG